MGKGSARTIFEEALELPPDLRDAHVAARCLGDAALKQRVNGLLVAHLEAGKFLASPESTNATATLQEGPGAQIGRYKILQLIGEGGFGSVFLAEQERPVSRRVALKITKLGMDTKAVIARFEAERQALAMMDHPNIAKVFDAGATDSGRPYFVMELVTGESVTRYCDRNQLSIAQRLDLFMQICHAVQHAHQKGIIHRDIKPNNILVSTHDGRPLAKIIDFGIAKATLTRLTEKTLFTEQHQLIGTPEYMSPEQAEGGVDIDTRTDVYSLGVLLYELLTGFTPFDPQRLRSAAFAEIQRIIREEDLEKPSTRLSHSKEQLAAAAEHRQVEPRKLSTIMQGDLDWIVMMCLEKDRTRRYETVNGLAVDIARYLAGEPVVAAPPSTAYRFRKFLQRNRSIVVASALIAVVLTAGMIGTIWQAVRAVHERDRAVAATDKAQKVKEVLERTLSLPVPMLSMVSAGPQERPFSPDVRLVDVIDESVQSLEGNLVGQPEVEADVRFTIGKSYLGLSRMADATRELRRALALYRSQFGEHDMRTLDCLHALGWSASWIGDFEEAETAFRTCVTAFERALGPRDNRTLTAKLSLAIFLMQMGIEGGADEGERLVREVLATRRELQGDASRDVIMSKAMLSYARNVAGDGEDSRQVAQESLTQLKALPSWTGSDEFFCLLVLGNSELTCGRLAEAEEHFRAIVQSSDRVAGTNSLPWAVARSRLGLCLNLQRRWEEAAAVLRESVDAFRRTAGPAHNYTISYRQQLARAYFGQGKSTEAMAELRENIDTCIRGIGPDQPKTLSVGTSSARILQARGYLEEAEAFARYAVEGYRRTQKVPSRKMIDAIGALATILHDRGRPQESLKLYEEIKTDHDQNPALGAWDWETWLHYGECLLAANQFADAERELLANRATLEASTEPDQELVRALVKLYDAWHLAEPQAGHDADAVLWRHTLENEETAASQRAPRGSSS